MHLQRSFCEALHSFAYQDVCKNKLIDSFVGKFKENLKDGLDAVSALMYFLLLCEKLGLMLLKVFWLL